MTSTEVREELVDALQMDLVGPTPEGLGDPAEWLDQAPSRWYLTGFLVPAASGPNQARDVGAGADTLETAEPAGETDDEIPRERPAVGERRLPSSVGLTVLLPEAAQRLDDDLRDSLGLTMKARTAAVGASATGAAG